MLITVQEAAQRLACSKNTIYRMVKANRLVSWMWLIESPGVLAALRAMQSENDGTK
jgi:hypothetical protein